MTGIAREDLVRYVGAIDQGTTSTRFIVFDLLGNIIESHQTEFDQIYPKPGWVEHDPDVILDSVMLCIDETIVKLELRGINRSTIKAVGITNQRETTVVWNKITGKKLHNAIVWLDSRTKDLVDELISKIDTQTSQHFQTECGLPLSTYFSAVKLRWLLDKVPAVKEAAENDTLCFGTIDSWLLYNLTGGKDSGIHVTDMTNASRTMLMNIHTLQWDNTMLSFFGINPKMLPKILSSAEVYGKLSSGLLKGVPLAGCLGDQHAALVGQRCIKPGMVKNTYGTGCFMLYNTGTLPVISNHGLLSTLAYKLGPTAPAFYALEGSIAIAGAGVKWLRDNLGIIQESNEVNVLASQVNDSAGVYFVPAFSGLFAPYWKSHARGCIIGMTQYTTKHHIARALLEAICYQCKEIIDAMGNDSGHKLTGLRVDGGLTNSDLCMQIQSDVIGIPVERPYMRETTALGAALAAAIGVGLINNIEDFKSTDKITKFVPSIDREEANKKFDGWKKAVLKSFD